LTGARTARFDVVVVGGRCAGAALGKRLADMGLSVGVLEAARLGTDHITSTHLIQPAGMEELDGLGVGEEVRAAAPALETIRLSYDGCEARMPYARGRAAHCLRRQALDPLLQRQALEAGVELRERSRVTELIQGNDGAVEGVLVEGPDGRRKRIRAGLVVGADGRNSTVAKLVEAERYLSYEGPRAVYWAYWPIPSGWDPHELYNTYEGRSERIIFPTDGEQLLIATVPPLAEAEDWRSDVTASYLADVSRYKAVAPHLEGSQPLDKVRGVLRPSYFFRRSTGPGWALIGDAGHHKEFIVGLGITDALRDARELAAAIGEEDPLALERWWRERDVRRIEMFHWSRELGDAQAVTPLQRLGTRRLAASPDLQARFGAVLDGELSPYDLLSRSRALSWVAGASLRGDLSGWAPLLAAAHGRNQARRELRRRRRLLRDLEAAAPGVAPDAGWGHRLRSDAPGAGVEPSAGP
jgi:flavin-dependent dehydrogenase